MNQRKPQRGEEKKGTLFRKSDRRRQTSSPEHKSPNVRPSVREGHFTQKQHFRFENKTSENVPKSTDRKRRAPHRRHCSRRKRGLSEFCAPFISKMAAAHKTGSHSTEELFRRCREGAERPPHDCIAGRETRFYLTPLVPFNG
ncbi:hypothetical protein TNCV_3072871 [Trichonephila clavipes]|nr:hypothetical protein TNCV_3072871 [Trichonephila clavipes]